MASLVLNCFAFKFISLFESYCKNVVKRFSNYDLKVYIDYQKGILKGLGSSKKTKKGANGWKGRV